jgi:hypothetical protein
LIKRTFDIEIADFPGEYSDRIFHLESETVSQPQNQTRKTKRAKISRPSIEDVEYTLFNKEFFSWIASSREYLFVVDLASIYGSDDPRSAVHEITARIRTSWQIIEDSASERGIGSVKHRPIHLIFTKSDTVIPIFNAGYHLINLLDPEEATSNQTESSKNLTPAEMKKDIGVRKVITNLAVPHAEPDEVLQTLASENNEVFSDLISFFKHRTSNVDVIYSSMTIADKNGHRLGIPRVLEACLP